MKLDSESPPLPQAVTYYASVLLDLLQRECGNIFPFLSLQFFSKPPQLAKRMLQIPQSPSPSLVSSCRKDRNGDTIKDYEKQHPPKEKKMEQERKYFEMLNIDVFMD